jgi:hypothetical protein
MKYQPLGPQFDQPRQTCDVVSMKVRQQYVERVGMLYELPYRGSGQSTDTGTGIQKDG